MEFVTKLKNWLFSNQTTGQTIAKNAFWLFFGQMASRLIRAAIVIYAARLLGAADWGAFSYALGVAAFLTIFSDIGINALITKETSRNPELKDQYLSTAFFTKLALLVIIIAIVIGAFPYLTQISEAAVIMPILIFVFAFDTLRELGSALSRALEKMEIEAGVQIFTNVAIVVLGFALLQIAPTARSLAIAYASGSGLGLMAIVFVLRKNFRNIFSHFNRQLIKPILTTAWPFGMMGLMGVIMLNTDIIMLGWMRSPEEVGYYSAAQKIIQLLYVLPAVFASSLFPVMARMVKSEPKKARFILKRSVVIAFSAAVLAASAGFLFSQLIISVLFGAEYLPGLIAFEILLITLIIVFPSTLIGNAIFAYDHQKSFILFVAVAVLGNIAFNALLIPRWGIEGAAASTLITQLITNGLIWLKMKKIGGI